MKKIIKFRFSAIISSFVFIVFFSISINAQASGNLNEMLKRLDAYNKSLQSLKADIAMFKYNSQLETNDEQKGKVAYRPNKKEIAVRIDWISPVMETLTVLNGQYMIYRPRLKQAIVGKADGKGEKGGSLAFLNMSKDELKANYKVTYLGDESISGKIVTAHLRLIPKKNNSYKQADLWVDINGAPRQSTIIEKNNDSTTVLLSNLEENKTIPASFFAIELPKNTKIING